MANRFVFSVFVFSINVGSNWFLLILRVASTAKPSPGRTHNIAVCSLILVRSIATSIINNGVFGLEPRCSKAFFITADQCFPARVWKRPPRSLPLPHMKAFSRWVYLGL